MQKTWTTDTWHKAYKEREFSVALETLFKQLFSRVEEAPLYLALGDNFSSPAGCPARRNISRAKYLAVGTLIFMKSKLLQEM